MMSRAWFCLLGLLAIPVVSAADPVLAQFSRSVFVNVDDSLGIPPGPEQVVNNLTRTGLVLASLVDPFPGADSVAAAFAQSSFGRLRVRVGTTSRDGMQKSATAEAGFQDVLTIEGMGVPGTTYRFSGAFLVTGSTTSLATTGLSAVNVAHQWEAYQDGGATRVGGESSQFQRDSSGFGDVGIDFLGTPIPVEFDFVWGDQVILVMALGAGSAANSISPDAGSFASASALLGDSLIWLGASIFDTTGAPVTATIIGDSRTDWSQPTNVPEPAVLALVALGLSAVRRRLQPRGVAR